MAARRCVLCLPRRARTTVAGMPRGARPGSGGFNTTTKKLPPPHMKRFEDD